jgi:hypothetical protein
MKSKNPKGVPITRFPLDPSHTLAQAMNRIDWALLESDELFQNGFKPIQPIRRVFGLMILETVRGLEGEQLLVQWLETPVLQYFTGETWFHWELPITGEEIEMCKAQLSDHGIGILQSMIDETSRI